MFKKWFKRQKTDAQCAIQNVSCSFREQVRQKQSDYRMLIESNRRDIGIFCKEPIVRWDDGGKFELENKQMKKNMLEYEKFLYEKIHMLENLLVVEANYN